MSPGWQGVALPAGGRLEVLDALGSTNDEVRLRARDRAPAGLVVLAERQTAGRGRRGAAWLSPPGEGLTFSVLLRPSEPMALWPRLSLVAGLAVAEALGGFGIEAEIKWPNDVLVGGRKICGILVEAGSEFVVVGIGVNVATRSFPEGLAGQATSVWIERGGGVERPELLERILASLAGWSGALGGGFPGVVRRVRERCALTGRRVRLRVGDGALEGTVQGVGEAGELLLETPEGLRKLLQAEEVRVV